MRPHLSAIVACLVLHATAFWETPQFSKKSRPELRDQTSYIETAGVRHTIFEHKATGANLDFVTNSGISETTPGVNQYSGYFSVGTNISYFFWFFEARHNPEHAPLAAWFNGGPGCSSMIGLFQENGPCQFYNGSSTPSLNPYSWNEYANMLYIDEPAGVGFSYQSGQTAPSVACDDNGFCQSSGVINATVEVDSMVTAAPFIWKFVQAFFTQFPQYENRDFGIFTEPFGGHYGPEFAQYFEQQNKAIEKGTVLGEKINLVALGINNGWYDSVIQERQEIEFYYKNSYYPMINESTYESLIDGYNDICLQALKKCTSAARSNLDFACMEANIQRIEQSDSNIIKRTLGVDGPAAEAFGPLIDEYDIRQKWSNQTEFKPPSTYSTWLSDSAIVKAIGAQGNYTECSGTVSDQFTSTGDAAHSLLPELSNVVKSGVNTLLWAGDADAVCDWIGGLACAEAVHYPDNYEFKHKEVKNYTVNGVVKGTYKTEGTLSWLGVFEAGHYVSYFQPALALQIFKQTMDGVPILPN